MTFRWIRKSLFLYTSKFDAEFSRRKFSFEIHSCWKFNENYFGFVKKKKSYF